MIQKFIKICAVALAFSGLVINPATASTWNVFNHAFNDDTLFYFDADTVQKQSDTVTLWLKYVKLIKADSDGSWSTAMKYTLTCSTRKYQVFASSTYDKDGKFMASNSNPGTQKDITPDSLIEEMHKVSCQKDFPKNKSREKYFPVDDNNIFAHSKRYVEYVESKKDAAPQ